MMAKKFSRKNLLILLSLLIPLLYFTQLHCREYRYLITFLPFVAITAAFGISSLLKKARINKFPIVIALALAISMPLALVYYHCNESNVKIMPMENFYHFAENKTASGEIWVTNPLINLYVNKKVNLLYYPLCYPTLFHPHCKVLELHYVSYNDLENVCRCLVLSHIQSIVYLIW